MKKSLAFAGVALVAAGVSMSAAASAAPAPARVNPRFTG